jgi:CubicO group peptidase (beta-lactamase class C family)
MEIDAPGALGFDPERLARIPAFLDETYVAPGLLPGAQILVAREGRPVLFWTAGNARADRTPLSSDAIFRIASMTKPITSIAFMMLVEEAKVALDQPVAAIVPELADQRVYEGGGGRGEPFRTRPPERPMLMIDLLRHTSGLTYDFQQSTPVDAAYRAHRLATLRGTLPLDEFAARVGQLPLEFSPGTAWNYSVSTDILGLVVERVSGLPLARFFSDRIFVPLGMSDTGFHVPPDKVARLTDAYSHDEKNGLLLYDKGADGSWTAPPTLVSGGGGLVSTSADYHRFCSMLLNGGSLEGRRLVGRKTLDLMTRNHLPGDADLTELSRSPFSEAIYSGQGFGLGFAVNMDPARAMIPGSAGEYYWGGIFSTFFFVDPVERVSMVFMTQLTPSSTYPIRRQLKTMIYAAVA